MITDLQGSGNLLSDPAIHSKDTRLFRERTNLRQRGIFAFYGSSTHEKCNSVCKKLGLHVKRPDIKDDEEGETMEVKVCEEEMACKDDDMIDFICDLCHKVTKLEFHKYRERTMNEEHASVCCDECTEKLSVMVTIPCNHPGCTDTYEYAPYFFEIMGFTLPKKCDNCRK